MSVPTPHYPMIIDWSEEDQVYVVTMPDLPGCRTHGDSYEEAARNGQDAVESWVTAVVDGGRPLPPPAHMGIGEQFNPLARLLDAAEAPVAPAPVRI